MMRTVSLKLKCSGKKKGGQNHNKQTNERLDFIAVRKMYSSSEKNKGAISLFLKKEGKVCYTKVQFSDTDFLSPVCYKAVFKDVFGMTFLII